jgi:hypothetical protein
VGYRYCRWNGSSTLHHCGEFCSATWIIALIYQKPNSTVYRTDCHLTTVRHANDISILFFWMKAIDIVASNRPKSARYAVGFFIASDSPFKVTDPTYMLLRFQDLHIRDFDYQRFNLISLSYHICVDGTGGLLLYDNNSSHAYQKALHLARQNPGKFKSPRFGHLISTWPPDSESVAVKTNRNISELVIKIQ